MSLQKQIEELASGDAQNYSAQDFALFNDFKAALLRLAQRLENSQRANF